MYHTMFVNLFVVNGFTALMSLDKQGNVRAKEFETPAEAIAYVVLSNMTRKEIQTKVSEMKERVSCLADAEQLSSFRIPMHMTCVSFDWDMRQQIFAEARKAGGFVKVHNPDKVNGPLKTLMEKSMSYYEQLQDQSTPKTRKGRVHRAK